MKALRKYSTSALLQLEKRSDNRGRKASAELERRTLIEVARKAAMPAAAKPEHHFWQRYTLASAIRRFETLGV